MKYTLRSGVVTHVQPITRDIVCMTLEEVIDKLNELSKRAFEAERKLAGMRELYEDIRADLQKVLRRADPDALKTRIGGGIEETR